MAARDYCKLYWKNGEAIYRKDKYDILDQKFTVDYLGSGAYLFETTETDIK